MLLVVDGSDHALAAARHAAFLFQEGSVQRWLVLNVQPPLEGGRASAFHSLDDLREMERARGEAALRRACAILDDAGANYEAQIGVGPAAQTIVEAARANQCDGIVLGTTLWSRLAACLGAGLTAKIVLRARMPVTLVNAPTLGGSAPICVEPAAPAVCHRPSLVVYPSAS